MKWALMTKEDIVYKLLGIALLPMFCMPLMGMGNRPPTDPATYQDILDVNKTVSANQQTEASDNVNTNNRIDALSETKILVEGAVRIYDGKRISLEAFNSYDVKHSSEFAMGTRILLKLGTSYEERLLKKQQKEIEALEALMKSK